MVPQDIDWAPLTAASPDLPLGRPGERRSGCRCPALTAVYRFSETGACCIHVEPVAREPSEQRLDPEAEQSLVADGVDRDVSDRMAVNVGEKGVPDQLVDQLEDVGLGQVGRS